jgi:transposase-like protein
MMSKEPRRRFTAEFKEQAVARLHQALAPPFVNMT